MTGCTFTGNYATYGGAIYNIGNVNLTNCNFTENSATNHGGAIYNDATVNLTGCTFTGNTAGITGSAIYGHVYSTLNVSYSVFYNNTGGVTINSDNNNCDLNDNFYFWIISNLNDVSYINSLKEDITNRPELITTFYYLNITNTSVSFVGETLNITSELLYNSGENEINKLPDLNNITTKYNDVEIKNYNYKDKTNITIQVLDISDNVVYFSYENYNFYQIPINVVAPTLGSISGTGVEGTDAVELTVDVSGTYYIIINNGTDDIFSGWVVFDYISFSYTITINNHLLNSTLTYTITAYDNYPDSGGTQLATGTITITPTTTPTLTTITGTGTEGTNTVDITVDTLGEYWITINDGNNNIYSALVTFTSLTQTITLTTTLTTTPTYTITAYNNNPDNGGTQLATGTITITPTTTPFSNDKLNYNKLVSEINASSGLDSSKYTLKSWTDFKTALDAAIAMNIARNATSQDEIDVIVNDLINARNSLVEVNSLLIPTPTPDAQDPETDYDKNTSNNSLVSATMKKTGIPIVIIFLVLLSSLGFVVRRK